ncbi:NAD(P)H-hydrate dehydratase [Listeria costaricensis]|uniref:NAD(P)H-hydrate dehydratase n=1 Tax=Listeria costaricensis TaxID=2026604 RepID=UPI000C07B9D6|nr:NAD(P)H-hydrate dehydratase [Listeria costaricensis]
MKKITPKHVCHVIHERDEEGYKNQYGKVLIVAGNDMYGGAGIMAAEGAVYSGAGLVTLASHPVNRSALHARLPECMFLDYTDSKRLKELLPNFDTLLIGPGLGLDETAHELLSLILAESLAEQQLIIDGDGITLFARNQLPKPKAQLIFTPHQGEWERLKNLLPKTDDPAEFAEQLPATLVLKGHRTRVYTSADIWQNVYGSPAMATGGMGDTLAGIIAGLLHQTEQPIDGLLAAVFFHSYIADTLAKKCFVVRPTEVAAQLPAYLKIFSEMTES